MQVAGWYAIKLFKYFGLLVAAHAYTFVCYLYYYLIAFIICTDSNFRGRSILYFIALSIRLYITVAKVQFICQNNSIYRIQMQC
jgi:hypothetical protein